MKILQVVPNDYYFVWQLYVQMQNFREWGIEEDAIILVANGMTEQFKKFERWTKAKVYYYADLRESREYTSSIRPNIIKQHLQKHPLDCFLYLDQDVIFTRRPDFDKLAEGDICYIAKAAQSYINVTYVDAFEKYQHLADMGLIVGIPAQEIRRLDNAMSTGGAQYVIKGTDYNFWAKVEKDCEAIYKRLHRDTLQDEINKVYHIQIWCADMWALLYNLWYAHKRTHVAEEINFGWPWEKNDGSHYTLHNAGIDPTNTHLKDGMQVYFYKAAYRRNKSPFTDDFSFVKEDKLQYEYVKYFKRLVHLETMEPKRKILGIFCTTNKIHPELLQTTIKQLAKAAKATTAADVQIVTCSWEPIPDNPFVGLITPFRELGHLNYILQIKQVLACYDSDITCILEHDMLYPADYFDTVMRAWDYGKYGVWSENYIGMNETGYLKVKERHLPFSTLSIATFYLRKNLDQKTNECLYHINNPEGWEVKNGWCCIEPDDKHNFKVYPFNNRNPLIHVNMNHLGGYGSGKEGKNHHFTAHCEVCYESDSKGETFRNDWGDYKQYFPGIESLQAEVK